MTKHDITLEETLHQIVKQTGIPLDEINKRIDAKIKNVSGLLTRLGAALVIADNLRVDIDLNKPGDGEPSITVTSIIDGMKNIVVKGTVMSVYPLKEFQKRDGKTGRVANAMLKDDTGTIRVSVWDAKAEWFVNNIRRGDTIELVNVRAKKSTYNGNMEIHADSKSSFNILQHEIPARNGSVQLKDMTDSMKSVTIVAKVEKKFQAHDFTKKDGSAGILRKVRVNDGTGAAFVIFWNERVGEIDGMEEGKEYTFENIGSKFSLFTNEYEFSVNRDSHVSEKIAPGNQDA